MKRIWWITGGVLAAVLMFVIGFCVGRCTLSTVSNGDDRDTTTFYATVESVDSAGILVKGLDVNDINHRGEFSLAIDENTAITWRGTPLKTDDLKVGNRVSVTYNSEVQETYPAGIAKVIRIDLLEDSVGD